MVNNPNADETNLRTFNTAKIYVEKILFPLMFDFKKFERQADFGSDLLDNSLEIPEEIRDIQRFNGLKAMADTCYNLLSAISSTVNLKNNKEEIAQLQESLKQLLRIKDIFYEQKHKFFKDTFKGTVQSECLDRNYFEAIKEIIRVCYVNTEILMTRNKLLFADSNDEFMSDSQIKEDIMQEYVDG